MLQITVFWKNILPNTAEMVRFNIMFHRWAHTKNFNVFIYVITTSCLLPRFQKFYKMFMMKHKPDFSLCPENQPEVLGVCWINKASSRPQKCEGLNRSCVISHSP